LARYSKLSPGDYVLFVRQGTVFWGGVVATLFTSRELAKNLWPVAPNGQAFELMYSITAGRRLSVDVADLNQAVDYAPNAVVQDFRVLDETKSAALINLVGALFSPQEVVSEQDYRDLVEDSMDPDLDEEMFKDAKGSAPSSYRKEQKFLREWLIPGAHAECDLCRRTFAAPFLRAAHIKPRRECSLEERLAFKSVVMRACLFGCDQLYELGWVVVANDGVVYATEKVDSASSEASYIEKHLAGKTCGAWNDETEVNFAWHRLGK
jgi:hypothetical protein